MKCFPPFTIASSVQRENDDLQERMREERERRKLVNEYVSAHRSSYLKVLKKAEVDGLRKGYWVATDWFKSWVRNGALEETSKGKIKFCLKLNVEEEEEDGEIQMTRIEGEEDERKTSCQSCHADVTLPLLPIQNESLVCEHSRLSPFRITQMKR